MADGSWHSPPGPFVGKFVIFLRGNMEEQQRQGLGHFRHKTGPMILLASLDTDKKWLAIIGYTIY